MNIPMITPMNTKKGISEALSVFIPIVLFMLFLVAFIFAAQFINFTSNRGEANLGGHVSPDAFTLSSLLQLSVSTQSESIPITLYDLLASRTERGYMRTIYTQFGVFIAQGDNIYGFFQDGEGYQTESVLYTLFVLDRGCASDITAASLRPGIILTTPQFYSVAGELTRSTWSTHSGLSGTSQYGGNIEIAGRCVLLFRHQYAS